MKGLKQTFVEFLNENLSMFRLQHGNKNEIFWPILF